MPGPEGKGMLHDFQGLDLIPVPSETPAPDTAPLKHLPPSELSRLSGDGEPWFIAVQDEALALP